MPRSRPLSRSEQLQLAVAAECDPRTVVRWLAGLPLTPPTQARLDAAALRLSFIAPAPSTPAAITSVKPPRA